MPLPTPFEQPVAASRRIDASRRARLAPRSTQETAQAFKTLARGALAGLAAARRAGADLAHLTRASGARHRGAALALAALYRRRAAGALSHPTTTGRAAA